MFDAHRRAPLAAALLLLTAQSPTPATAPLAPQGPWVVDYAETQCTAIRKYRHPGGMLTFGVRPAPTGDSYELLVGWNRAGPDNAQELKGSVDFGQGPIEAWLLHYGGKSEKGEKLDAYAYRISANEMAKARSSKAVTVNTRGGPDITLGLDNMGPLLAGLQTCTDDLKRYWNFDGLNGGTIAVPSKGNARGLLTTDDYPDEAVLRGQQGTAQFLLLVDEKGGIAGCHVQKPSGIPLLDATGCQVMRQRMKMKPARDAQGRPVRSTVVTPPVTWQLFDSQIRR